MHRRPALHSERNRHGMGSENVRKGLCRRLGMTQSVKYLGKYTVMG